MKIRIRIVSSTLLLTSLAASTLAFAADRQVQTGVWTQSAPFGTRIVGGTPAVGDRSFTVRTSPGCGGTILNDRWVLTAAHCGTVTWVRAGSTNLSSATQYTVAQYIRHPNYSASSSAGSYNNDYALVQINGTFPTNLIRAKLPDATVMQAVAKPGDLVTTLGWGATSEGGSGTTSLREVTIPVVSDTTCAASYNGSSAASGLRLIPSVQICAGLAAGGKDSCQGDSGGPLIAPYNGSIYSIGVVSYGLGCARANYYGVYSETVAMVSWISSNIGGTTPPPTGQTYTNGTDVAIGDNTTVESTIAVSGRTGNGSATTPVAVNIVHTYIGDLKVDLIAPDGSLYVLHNRAGGGTDNINQTYTVNLSSEPLNGTWRLRVNDNANADTGYINSWSVTF
jgi:secreted trypsin-like serine protease